MARLGPNEIARTWLANGGAHSAMVIATAVSVAESGGDTDAISPSNDYGLWQINTTNFRALGVNSVTVRDRDVNARCAIRLSGNGNNWADWCTCWVSIHNCGHGYLPAPQVNSAAWRDLSYVAQVLNEAPPDLGPVPDISAENGIHYAWSYFQNIIGPFSRQIYNDMSNLNAAIRRL